MAGIDDRGYSEESDDTRRLIERLREEALRKNLPHASFYFTYLADHFLAMVANVENIREDRASPFVYAMQ
ncbi:MAG TPA: hypothetical protein VK196_06970 [Magnetospirillum sp.]|nr:hypothetical protein [Magnetospirillum sp.]